MARHDQVLGALRRIIRANDRYSRQLSKADGLTAPQLLILQTLGANGDQAMGEIARRVSLSQGTVTSILDRLEDRGLLERWRGSSDKRRVYARITEAGRMLIAQAPLPLQEDFRRRFAELREHDQNAIVESLEQVAAMMSPDEPEAPGRDHRSGSQQ